jgi:hypothetical protein
VTDRHFFFVIVVIGIGKLDVTAAAHCRPSSDRKNLFFPLVHVFFFIFILGAQMAADQFVLFN